MIVSPRSLGFLLAGAIAAGAAGAARAESALAIALPARGAQEGFAYGWAVGYDDLDAAKEAAVRTCRESRGSASRAVRRLCRVETTFHEGCVAVAMDPENGTPGVGWAVAATKILAERGAVAACHETAGEGRRLSCRVTASACDASRGGGE